MESRKKHRWLLLCACIAGLVFYGSSISAQTNIPDAVDEPITASDGSVWEQVSLPGFNSVNNMSVVAMAEYDDSLYAMTRNNIGGAEVWRTTSDGGWEQVLFPNGETNGIYGNPWVNNVWGRMIVFNNKLYFGFSSGLQGSILGSTGCEIWSYDGTTWEPVISDIGATTAAGSITAIEGCARGDGNTQAVFTDSTKNWGVNEWAGGILRITSGDGKYRKFDIVSNTATTLTIQQNEDAGSTDFTVCAAEVWDNPFPLYSYTLGAVAVGDGYAIAMGTTQNGFGQTWNKTITAMRIFDNKLYVSTGLNYKYGGQVWYTADGDTWNVTASIRDTLAPYTYHSFGNFHTDANYPGSRKPVSTSVTDLVVSSVSGTPVLYAGGTGSSGSRGGCARMARLTANGWELIVDSDIADGNTTGTNENGFGSPSPCGTNKFNFMPWSLAEFNDELMVGISGEGARVIRAPYLFTERISGVPQVKDMKDDGRWFYSVGQANIASSYTDPLGTTLYPNGFDGYKYPGTNNYQNLAVNLFPFRNMLYGGTISQYVPEYNIPVNLSEMTGAQIWKTPTGLTWTPIIIDGFGDSEVIMFEAFTDFGGTLYVSASKGASSTPSSLGGAKIYRLASEPCVNVTPDQDLAADFERYTVTGITTPLPGPDPNPPGFLAASFLRAGDLDGDGIKEIVVSSTQGQSLNYMIKDGAVAVFKRTSEDLSTWTQSIIRADFAFANDMLIRDVDGDGEVDIMVFDNFLAGDFTEYPAGIFYLKNLGGDVSDPANWQKVEIFEDDVIWDEGRPDNYYLWAKSVASYHQAHFLDLDGDGREDFITGRVGMAIWQARDTNPDLYNRQYMWTEWFRSETDLVTYPSGFSGPYDIGDGAGFLFGMHDVDGDGLKDILGPQFFITNPGSLVIKGPDDPYPHRGDSLMWFRNPGAAALQSDRNYEWESYTIDNWYESDNPMGKGFMAFPADITNDGEPEIIFTGHNHQDYRPDSRPNANPPVYAQYRVWPSGIYYLSVPDDPYDSANWSPVTIDAGDAYKVDRPGGPYSQGSPGHAAVGDITGNGLNDIVVAGDGRGALYYYQASRAGGCLNFRRAALYDDPGCMSAEVKLYDIDNDGELEVLATVYDTSFAKNSSSGSVFIWKRTAGGACELDSDCPEGYECINWQCQPPVVPDDPPQITAGPYLAAGPWPLLPTTPESAFVLDENYDVLWKFSDDFASCSGDCTHAAEYQAVGGGSWTALDVTANAARGTARVTLPVESLVNGSTYALRFSVTDCASQTTESNTYYFRVAVTDAPPVITGGPWLAAGPWPLLPTALSSSFVLDQNYDVLWTFSDDYAFCSGLCTHRARYRRIVDDGSWIWTWLPVTTDATGTHRARVTLPIESMQAGDYMFYFDVRDCAGQRTSAPKVYYFKVDVVN